MGKTYRFKPKNVCSREMLITYQGDTIVDLKVVGGCQGNVEGLSRLVAGRTMKEIIPLLEGIPCRGSLTKATSCPDQLTIALKAIEAGEKKD